MKRFLAFFNIPSPPRRRGAGSPQSGAYNGASRWPDARLRGHDGNCGESGNVFTALLAAIALTGVIGVAAFNLLSGPISGMSGINKNTIAETQVRTIARIAIMDAANQANSGDCDSDYIVEPMAGRDSGGTTEYVPYSLGAPVTDPWGTQYRYCVWDIGSISAAAGCGVGAQRLNGTDNPYAGEAKSQTVLAVFSAGPDKTANSTCADYTNGTTAVFAKLGDDIAMAYSYTEAAKATLAPWTLKSGDPNTAQLATDFNVGASISIDAATGGAGFTTLSSTGQIIADAGVDLGNETDIPAGDCALPADKGLLRYNEATDKLEVCDGAAWAEVGGGGAGATADITTGLAAYWKFDETGGTTANDSSGNSNTGTLTNGPVFNTNGVDGGTISFDGGNDYVAVANSTSLNISGTAITISLWLNTPQGYITALTKPWTNGVMAAPYHQYAIKTSNNLVTFYFGNGAQQYQADIANPEPNQWHHFVYTYDGVHVKGYRDNVEVLSIPETVALVARGNPLRMGIDTTDMQPYSGYMDDVRIYNRALSSTDVEALYDIGSASVGSSVVAGGSSGGGGGGVNPPTLNSEWTDSGEGYIFFNKGAVAVGIIEQMGGFHLAMDRDAPSPIFGVSSYSTAPNARLDFYHAGGTENAPTNLSTGDQVGKIQVMGWSSTANWVPSMEINTYVGSSAGTGRMDIKLATTAGALTSAFSVNEKGHVGVGGVSNAGAGLEIAGTDPDLLLQGYTDAGVDAKPSFIMRRARGTYSAPSAAQSGDVLGLFGFAAYDGNSYETAAAIAGKVSGTATGAALPTDLVFYTGSQTIDPTSATKERMRVASSGNVGFGHDNPQNMLHVGGVMRVMDTGTQQTYAIGNTVNFFFDPKNTVFRVGQGGSAADSFDPARIGAKTWGSGVGCDVTGANSWSFCHGYIGSVAGDHNYSLSCSDPLMAGSYNYCVGAKYSTSGQTGVSGTYNLMLGGGFQTANTTYTSATTDYSTVMGELSTITADYSYAFGKNVTVTAAHAVGINLSAAAMTLAQANTMSIMNGNVGIGILNPTHQLQVVGAAGLSTGTAWTNTSDIRLKNINGDYERGLDDITKLHTVRFRYKKDNPKSLPSDIDLTGFIAQEVQPIFPEAVSVESDGWLDFNIHSINVAMVNAVQELNNGQEAIIAERQELLTRHDELTAKLLALKEETHGLLSDMGLTKIELGWSTLFLLAAGGFSWRRKKSVIK